MFLGLIYKLPVVSAFELNTQTELEKSTMSVVNNSVVGERIKYFNSNVVIQKDGSIVVVEEIKYYFDSPRHGIFRNIPFTKYSNGKRYDLDFTFIPVTDDSNKRYHVSKSKDGEQWVLKIGDPDRTISGDHTYIISYTVKGALGYFTEHDELFWNVTGNGWDVPIQKASDTILFPEKLSEDKIKLICYS